MTLRGLSKRVVGSKLHDSAPGIVFRKDEDVRQEHGEIRIKLEPAKQHIHKMQLEGDEPDSNEYLLDIHPIIMVMLIILLVFTAFIAHQISLMPPEVPLP